MFNASTAPKPVLAPPLPPSQQAWRLRPVLPADALALRENCLTGWTLDQVDKLIRRAQRNAFNRRGMGLVVELGGLVVAFGQVTLWPNTAEISDIIVGEPWRRRGIGSGLVLRLVDVAREMSSDAVEIGVALRDYAVLLLYRKLGFAYGRTIDLDLGEGLEPVMYMQIDFKAQDDPLYALTQDGGLDDATP